jgi:UDP-2,3-diacylglucosamine pyrophosphatase LpxH
MLRRFEHFPVGNFHIVNKMVIHHGDGKRSLIFHGDVFDVIMQHSKWLAKLGAVGYDTLIYINAFINYISKKLGKNFPVKKN